MEQFFGITEGKYKFEIFDLTAILTVLNVVFVLIGFKWAPIFGLVNCGVFVILNCKSKAHINSWITQIALVILNCYFLTL